MDDPPILAEILSKYTKIMFARCCTKTISEPQEGDLGIGNIRNEKEIFLS